MTASFAWLTFAIIFFFFQPTLKNKTPARIVHLIRNAIIQSADYSL